MQVQTGNITFEILAMIFWPTTRRPDLIQYPSKNAAHFRLRFNGGNCDEN
jgi:hypothetical protein